MWWNKLKEIINSYDEKNEELSEFALSKEALKHSESYTELLNIYTKSTKRNSIIKDVLKVLFFIISMGLLIAIVIIFGFSLKYVDNFLNGFDDKSKISLESILAIFSITIPAISSLIVAFIKIPKIIAKYLFNIKEENFMNEVIKNIQDHDQSMFAMEHKLNSTLEDNKKRLGDDSFEKHDKKDPGSGTTDGEIA